MFRLLHRAIFHAHITTGVLASFLITHRIITRQHQGTACPFDRVLQRLDAVVKPTQKFERDAKTKSLVPIAPTPLERLRYIASVHTLSTALSTGSMALFGSFWFVTYPLVYYISHPNTNLSDWVKRSAPYMR